MSDECFCAICEEPAAKILEGCALAVHICARCGSVFSTGVTTGMFAVGQNPVDVDEVEVKKATDLAILHLIRNGLIDDIYLLMRGEGA